MFEEVLLLLSGVREVQVAYVDVRSRACLLDWTASLRCDITCSIKHDSLSTRSIYGMASLVI